MNEGRYWGRPLGVVSLVFGIIALILGFSLAPFFPVGGIIFAAIPILFGFLGIIGAKRNGMAIVGLSFGLIVLVFSIVFTCIYGPIL